MCRDWQHHPVFDVLCCRFTRQVIGPEWQPTWIAAMGEIQRQQQACQALDSAAASEHLPTLQRLIPVARPEVVSRLCSRLAWAGKLDTLKCVHSLFRPPCSAVLNASTFALAAEGGRKDVMAWLLSQGCPVNEHAYDAPARRADMDMLMWLASEVNVLPDESTTGLLLTHAATIGRVDLLQWLMEICKSPELEAACWSAAACAAAEHGHLPILQHLHQAGKLRDDMLRRMTMNFTTPGHWSIMQWSLAALPAGSNLRIDRHLCAVQAAKQGRVDMMQWLAELDRKGKSFLCKHVTAAAARCGDIAMLSYLRSLVPPCPWNFGCFVAAIHGGHPSVLEWLIQQGCSLLGASEETKRLAIGRVSHKVMPWIAEHMSEDDFGDQLEECSNGRLIYLDEAGWWMPTDELENMLQNARDCFCAYYGAARWLGKQQGRQTTLGSLDNELLERIACEAQIDCSEFYDDLGGMATKAQSNVDDDTPIESVWTRCAAAADEQTELSEADSDAVVPCGSADALSKSETGADLADHDDLRLTRKLKLAHFLLDDPLSTGRSMELVDWLSDG